MYDPRSYLGAITIAGVAVIPAATRVVPCGGAVRSGLGRRHAALLATAPVTPAAIWRRRECSS